MGLALEFAHSNYSNGAAFLAVCSPALANPANHAVFSLTLANLSNVSNN